MIHERLAATRKSSAFDARVLVVLFFVMIFLPNVPRFLGYLTGQIWPVVTPAEIVAVAALEPNRVRLELQAVKLRNCDWRGVQCYIGQRGGSYVPLRPEDCHFTDQPEVRGQGLLHWDGLEVGIRPDMIPDLFVDVTHECQPLFDRRSEFYTGDNAEVTTDVDR